MKSIAAPIGNLFRISEYGFELAMSMVPDPGCPGKALVTIMVDDLGELVASLREEGLETPAIETVPGFYRKVVITDPEGNIISFGEDISIDG